MLTWKLSRGV